MFFRLLQRIGTTRYQFSVKCAEPVVYFSIRLVASDVCVVLQQIGGALSHIFMVEPAKKSPFSHSAKDAVIDNLIFRSKLYH